MFKRLLIISSVLSLILIGIGCGMPTETLRAVGNEGLVKVVAEPSSAMVYVDGNLVGKAHDFNGNPGLLKLTHGTHTIELKKDGYQSYTRRIFVGNGALEPISITLLKNK